MSRAVKAMRAERRTITFSGRHEFIRAGRVQMDCSFQPLRVVLTPTTRPSVAEAVPFPVVFVANVYAKPVAATSTAPALFAITSINTIEKP